MVALLNALMLPVILLTVVAVLNAFGKRKTKKLGIRQKNGWLLVHITFVIMYFGGLLGTLLLAVSTTHTTDGGLIYAAHLYIQYFDWFLIIPGGLGSVITGVWLATRTHWGLMKHYWVIAKWVGNIAAITFGGNIMRVWIHDNFARTFPGNIHPLQNPAYLHNREMLLISTAISFAILIFLLVISYFKPWGKRGASHQTPNA